MGVLQRFERRLEGLVEGAFARVFGGVVQPVEVAAALQREAEDKKAIVGQGRVLVPNDFVVELGQQDSARLTEYDAPLRRELAAMVDEHAREKGWSFVGPVAVRFERLEHMTTGTFRVRSAVVAPEDSRVVAAPVQRGQRAAAAAGPGGSVRDRGSRQDRGSAPDGAPWLEVIAGGTGRERIVALDRAVTSIGRGPDADLRLPDTGVSRLHAELRVTGAEVVLVDLKSTNGTLVNGKRVDTVTLRDGDRVAVGTTSMVFRTGPA